MKSTIHYILLAASFFTVNFLPVASQNVSPTPSQNHSVSYTFRQAFTPSQVPSVVTIDQAVSSVTYYDGIGRAVQSVEAGGTSAKKDLVTPVEYDVLGRADVKQHLPYPLASAGVGYQSNALAAQKSYYTEQFSVWNAHYAYNYKR